MKHEHIKNDFFAEKSSGPSVSTDLRSLVRAVIPYRVYFSKRLAPPFSVCNARIYAGTGEFLHSTDLNVQTSAPILEGIAELADVELFVFGEHGPTYYWRSSEPRIWQGGAEVGGEWRERVAFEEAEPFFRENAEKQARQWRIDRGLERRSFREWVEDCLRRVRWFLREIRRKK